MNEITINKEKVAEVYQNASAETREALIALFGDESNFIDKSKPTLDDYTTIKTYEDACEALGMVPMLNQSDYELTDDNGYMVYFPPHIIALMKLETISRALWGRTWKPEPDADGSKQFYFPVFALYTKSEIDNMDEDERGACCLRVRIVVRFRATVVWARLIVPRLRMRTVGSACAKKQGKKLCISASSSLSCGRNI